MKLYPVIGVEVHVELNTKTKLFSDSPNDTSSLPNHNVSPYDLGFPGSLPVLNFAAVKKALVLANLFKCQLNIPLRFDRKHYFYYDLPKGFQITQFFYPIGINGSFACGNNNVIIAEIHLEEDTARQHFNAVHNEIYLDFNRAGVPLIEIVSSPCFFNAEQVCNFLEKLKTALIYLNISAAQLEEGEIRCDVNLSMQQDQNVLVNPRIEIKNLNSYRAIKNAVEYEINRQTELIVKNKSFSMETRRYDDTNNKTILMRKKTETIDYNFFPEPNLPNVYLKSSLVKIANDRANEYFQKLTFLLDNCRLVFDQAKILLQNSKILNYYQACVLKFSDIKKLNNMWFNFIIPILIKQTDQFINLDNLILALDAVFDEKLAALTFKNNLTQICQSDFNINQFLKANQITQSSDEKVFALIKEIISHNPSLPNDYKQRPDRTLKFIIGQIMHLTKGKISPQILPALVEKFFLTFN